MYEQKTKNQHKKLKTNKKEKHKQQKKRNKIKIANCIYQNVQKKPQDKRNWRCPAIF